MYSSDEHKSNTKKKFNYKSVSFDSDYEEIDPIQTDNTDLDHLFDNENAISFDIKNNSN